MSAVPNLPEAVHEVREPIPDVANGVNGINGVNGHGKETDDFKMHETPVENIRPVKVIVIGAGYSGIYCGIRIPEKIKNCKLTIYEKNSGVGGTW